MDKASIEDRQDDDGTYEDDFQRIVDNCSNLIERKYLGPDGDVFTFVGVIYGKDDYYYGMHGGTGLSMLSCAANIEDYGFTLMREA